MRSLFSLSVAVSVAVLALAAPGGSAVAPGVTLTPRVGPPGTLTHASGVGFAAGETVDLDFDSTQLGTATANGSGSFANAAITIPNPASPGAHTVTAHGESSGLGAQTTFLVRANWAMYGFGPQRRGENPYETVIGRSNVAGLHTAWSFLTSNVVGLSPVVAVGRVYEACGNALCALDAATGSFDWSYATGYSAATPAASGGMVYVGCTIGICALDGVTGALRWSYATRSPISSPVVSNGVVYVGADQLYALNASTGVAIWVYAGGGFPSVGNGVVYAAKSGALAAVDAATGAVRWTTTSTLGCAAVANGVVYTFAYDATVGADEVVALDPSTGAERWSYSIGPGHGLRACPAVGNGVVYAGTDNARVFALRTSDGSLLWKGATSGRVDSAPVLANGVLYVNGSYGGIVALDTSTGAPLWTFATNRAAIEDSPTVVNGMLYVGSNDHTLYALEP